MDTVIPPEEKEDYLLEPKAPSLEEPKPKSKIKPILTLIAAISLLLLGSFILFFYFKPHIKKMMSQNHTEINEFNSLVQISSTASSKALLQAEENIVKAKIDRRQYKGIELGNGIKALLISDPDSSVSSAAVGVKVGTMEDPEEMLGLAHFCEHMVFLKSKEYPILNDMQDKVSKSSGLTNAFTNPLDTNFYFQVSSGAFEETLKIFSHFFIDPIFTEDLMKEEVASVDSEYHRNLNVDAWRLRLLMELIGNPKSSFSKFSTGNTETLVTKPQENGVDIVKTLQRFFDEHYSANAMSLAISDNRPLEELEEMAVEIFSKVPNKHVKIPDYSDEVMPFSEGYGNKLVQFIPNDPARVLYLVFNVESEKKHPFLEAYSYLGQLISDRGKGSLTDVLSEKGLAHSVSGGDFINVDPFDVFFIQVVLSDYGLENMGQVTEIIFAYLDLVIKQGLTKELYGQFSRINRYKFNYMESSESLMNQISTISQNLLKYPLKYAVSGSSARLKYNKKLLEYYISQVNSKNLMMFVTSPQFVVGKTEVESVEKKAEDIKSEELPEQTPADQLEVDKIEKIQLTQLDKYNEEFDISYAVNDLSKSFIERLSKVSYEDYPELKITGLNDYIPKDFKLVNKPCSPGVLKCVQDYEEDVKVREPKMIKDSDSTRIWYQLDRSSRAPRIVGNIHLDSHAINRDLFYNTVANMKMCLIEVLLEDTMYDMGLAGEMVEFSPTEIKLNAFSDVFPSLLKMILEQFKSTQFTEEQFHDAKQGLVSKLYMGITEKPFMNLLKYKSKIMLENYFLEAEIYHAVNSVSYLGFKKALENLYSPLFIESLFMGNLLPEEAKKLNQEVVKILGYKPIKDHRSLQNRVLDIRGKNLVFRDHSPISHGDQGYIINSYQVGVVTVKNAGYMMILASYLNMIVYSYLRTEQKLCYFVNTGVERLMNTLALNVMVESSVLSPHEVDEQIEIALLRGEDKLKGMTDEEFGELISSLDQSLEDGLDTLGMKASKHWSHIVNQDYFFDMRERVQKYLPNLTKEGLLETFTELIRKPNKISIQLYPETIESLPADLLAPEKQLSGSEAELIDDLSSLEALRRFPTELQLVDE